MIRQILLIEDDLELSNSLVMLLRNKDFGVKAVYSGAEALNSLNKTQPDLILLDLGLPDIDGQALCLEIKNRFPECPIIILTARDDINEKVKGFEKGADDYLTKPFEPQELFARIKKRIQSDKHSPILKVSDLTLNNQTIEVFRGDKKISLTPQEFKLLEYFMENQGIVLSRDMILNRIWLYSSDVDTRVVDVYVGYLRKKIDSGNKNKLIHSVRGFGYMIKG